MNDDVAGLGVRLGTHLVPAIGPIEMGEDEDGHAILTTVSVAPAKLRGQPADYRSEARLQAGALSLSRGWVSKATVVDDRVDLEVRNSPPMKESTIGLFSTANLPGLEIAWTMAHWMEATPFVPDLTPVRESMLVMMPVIGLELAHDLDLGSIRITTDPRIAARAAKDLEDSPGKSRFLGAKVWASSGINAELLLVAERAAVGQIETALDRLALEAQYSLATDPAGVALAFDRAGLLTDPRAVRWSLVHGLDTKRTWLRSLDHQPVRLPVAGRRLPLDGVPDEPTWNDALRAWRRAGRERDRLSAVLAIFEAIEFYASGVKVSNVVPRASCRRARRAIKALGLGAAEAERLVDVLSLANDLPLMVRLRLALDADQVPHSADELAVIQVLRKLRNEALHGRSRGQPQRDDVDLALGLVNRMLVYRAWRSGVEYHRRDDRAADEQDHVEPAPGADRHDAL